ncbi:hypothetical protein [Streptomyces sp. NPDC002644]
MTIPFVDSLEVVVPVLVVVIASLQTWKSRLTATWREIAEAQTIKADLLAEKVEALTKEVTALRAENAELRAMLEEKR